MLVSTLLIAARAKLDAGWCQGQSAIDATGLNYASHPWSSEVVRVCALGALQAVGLIHGCCAITKAMTFLNTAVRTITGGMTSGVVLYNDQQGRRKADMLKVFDLAIRIALAEEPPVAEGFEDLTQVAPIVDALLKEIAGAKTAPA